jgi:hypothetical protein
VVAGVGLFVRLRRTHECHFGGTLLPETRTRSARVGLFIPNRLQEQVLDAPGNKKPGAFCAGLLVVDYTIEISNLELVRGLMEVIDYME